MTVKPTPPSAARDKVRATVPKLIDLTEKVLLATCGSARNSPSATAASLPARRWSR